MKYSFTLDSGVTVHFSQKEMDEIMVDVKKYCERAVERDDRYYSTYQECLQKEAIEFCCRHRLGLVREHDLWEISK